MIEIIVRNKIAKLVEPFIAICGNSDYMIRFNFDEEWDAYETKTARFKWNSTYVDVVFTGNECAMPVVNDAYGVEIGVYAGDLHTTTGAYLPMKKSILCGTGTPTAPPDDVYNQIMHKLNNLAVEGYEELKAGQPTNTAVLAALNSAGLVAPIAGDDGAVLTDGVDNVFIF